MNICAQLFAASAVLASTTGPALAQAPTEAAEAKPDQPNILWLTLEDFSPDFAAYGNTFARTPAIDAFGRQSVRYTRAFASSPVCSPSRSTLITGVYATSLGSQRLRSKFAIPSHITPFTTALREAGYYTTNNSKTDYNFQGEKAFIEEAWDESSATAHYKNRKPGQPFFAVFNTLLTHQSRTSAWSFEQFEKEVGSKLNKKLRADPNKVPLPPYYPDTPTVRKTVARYYDCAQAADQLFVKPLLDELKREGLAEDTIVFLYSDHGSGMPRHKRLLHDSGMRVPLWIHFPKKYAHLAPGEPGSSTDRLVSFVDFGPTVLRLAGLEVPKHMMGRPFLPVDESAPRTYIFGARDRVDEAYDLSRSVRGHRYLYIRNYMPHRSLNQPEWYSDQSDMRREITRMEQLSALSNQGPTMTPAQLHYAGPSKPLEELYDTLEDPFQIRNLAADATYAAILATLRSEMLAWQGRTNDLGFIPEPEVERVSGKRAPTTVFKGRKTYPLAEIRAAASLVGNTDDRTQALQSRLLKSPEPAVRYWAAMGLSLQKELTGFTPKKLRKLLRDRSSAVRIAAADALLHHNQHIDAALKTLEVAMNETSEPTALMAARAIQLLGRLSAPLNEPVKARLQAAEKAKGAYQMYIKFALDPIVGH